MEFKIVETVLSDGSKVYAVHFVGIHESSAVLAIVIDCLDQDAAIELSATLEAAYTAVWINDRVQS